MSDYRQAVFLDIAMGMLMSKLGWATHLGSRTRQIVVVFGSCEIIDETMKKVRIELGYSMSAQPKRPSWKAWKVCLKKTHLSQRHAPIARFDSRVCTRRYGHSGACLRSLSITISNWFEG